MCDKRVRANKNVRQKYMYVCMYVCMSAHDILPQLCHESRESICLQSSDEVHFRVFIFQSIIQEAKRCGA